MYELEADKWTLITDDTSAMGGPCLLFDHHVAIDVDQQTLYVFGGRQITRYSHTFCCCYVFISVVHFVSALIIITCPFIRIILCE